MIQKLFKRILIKFNDYYYSKWEGDILCKSPLLIKDEYLKLYRKSKNEKFCHIEALENKYNFSINQKFINELALHTQIVKKKSKLCYQHGKVLYVFLRKYLETTNENFINLMEVGTARGFSAIVMAKALEDSTKSGKVFTFDVLPHNKKMYWNCIDDLEGKKTRKELLIKYKAYLDKYIVFIRGDTEILMPFIDIGRIHFAFIDGLHNYKYVNKEISYISEFQKCGDIIVCDDYDDNNFPGVIKAIDEYKNKYLTNIFNIALSRKICIMEKK